jgi:hypothetical protein
VALLVWSTKIANLWSPPLTVPTKESRNSTCGGLGGTGGAFGADTEETTSGGGLREGEKIGRSRVSDRVANGTAQSGLPLSRLTGDCSGASDLTAGARVAGESQSEGLDDSPVLFEVPVSNPSAGSAEVEAGIPSEGARISASRIDIRSIALCLLMSSLLAEIRTNTQLISPEQQLAACIRDRGGGEAGIVRRGS